MALRLLIFVLLVVVLFGFLCGYQRSEMLVMAARPHNIIPTRSQSASEFSVVPNA